MSGSRGDETAQTLDENVVVFLAIGRQQQVDVPSSYLSSSLRTFRRVGRLVRYHVDGNVHDGVERPP